ncbi:GIY-YIG nuclease family protein [Candidatus Woesebacteria bacterium]|nr:GIY-YIG nuclease family protein [Candidatus Woesebacteria bacterium]
MSYFCYIVRCADGSLYTGITTDIQRRLKEHNSKSIRGAKYTRFRLPVKLVHSEQFPDRSSAMKREYEIKHLPREEKEQLIISEDQKEAVERHRRCQYQIGLQSLRTDTKPLPENYQNLKLQLSPQS